MNQLIIAFYDMQIYNETKMEVSQRIQKMESDINLISSIRDILMFSSSNDRENCCPVLGSENRVNGPQEGVEFPVRDSKSNDQRATSRNICRNVTTSRSAGKCHQTNEGVGVCENDKPPNSGNILSSNELESTSSQSQPMERLREEINQEIKKRLDAEGSAKVVMIRLQKVEDELRRENDIKRSLLEGTLELKNQLQSYHSQIYELEKVIQGLQVENSRVSSNQKILQDCRLQQIAEHEKQIQLLAFEKGKLIQRNSELDKELEILKERDADYNSQFHKSQESFANQECTLRTQLDSLAEKVAQGDERQLKTEQKLKLASTRLQTIKEKLKSSDLNLKTHLQTFSIQIKEKEEHIKFLNSRLKQERQGLAAKIGAATNLVSRTKSFIVGLQNEKQVKENQAQKFILDIRQLQHENALLGQKLQDSKRDSNHKDSFRERFWSLNQENEKKNRLFEEERDKLKQQLHYEIQTNSELRRNQERLQDEMINAKRKYEDEILAGENRAHTLREELRRVSDNLQILQKISEDQGKTITKQRNELETNSELGYKLEMQLRESLETEKVLCLRLREEEKSCRELELQVSSLEYQLSLLKNDVKEHNCEDFVESKFLGKVKELERKVLNLDEDIKSKEEASNKVVAAARKAVSQTIQIKDSCEQKMLKMKNASAIEIMKIRQESQQQENDRNKKVCELESELMKTRENWRQMQNAYLAKILHLKTALSACVGLGVGSISGVGNASQQGNFRNFQGFGGISSPSCAANFNLDGVHRVNGIPFL